jgi:penicillin V acylase-like amidase (Ntn superfamily)
MRRILALTILLGSLPVFACTTFVLEGGKRIYLGRNLDWDWDQGIVVVNQRNIQKRAFVMSTNAVKWISKYGSVTFDQFGRELPFGGMNEAGLVVENMWLDQTQYPAADTRPEINMLQWIQYQLDNFSSVKEVIESDKKIRLENTPVRARIHYLICDAQGDSATIEFLNGEMKVHYGKELPYPALANDPYDTGAKVLQADASRADTSKPLASKDSISRFCRAAARAENFKAGKDSAEDVAYAFDSLNQVRQGNYTVWQMVYDISERKIHFRTNKNKKERFVDLKTLNYSCKGPIQIADIQADPSAIGTVVFHDFVEADHRAFVTKFYSQDSVKQTVGDLSMMIEPFLMTLHSYKCAE